MCHACRLLAVVLLVGAVPLGTANAQATTYGQDAVPYSVLAEEPLNHHYGIDPVPSSLADARQDFRTYGVDPLHRLPRSTINSRPLVYPDAVEVLTADDESRRSSDTSRVRSYRRLFRRGR